MIAKIQKNWKALTLIVGILSAGSFGGTVGMDHFREVGSNTEWILIQTFERLTAVRKSRRLTVVEWRKWCNAGIRLRVFKVCPQR